MIQNEEDESEPIKRKSGRKKERSDRKKEKWEREKKREMEDKIKRISRERNKDVIFI